jgi:hypothetical protein
MKLLVAAVAVVPDLFFVKQNLKLDKKAQKTDVCDVIVSSSLRVSPFRSGAIFVEDKPNSAPANMHPFFIPNKENQI